MTCIYDYEGFKLEISVEHAFTIASKHSARRRPGYVAVVRIFRATSAVAACAPLRFGAERGTPFATEADALIGGYGAARTIVDDVFCASGTAA